MSTGKIYFKNLDSIRFFAALMVFLAHGISPSYQYLPIENTVWEKLLTLISSGGTGVSIFFVLSGFLITYLLIQEYETTKTISVRNFYMRRVLRIWPLYYLVVTFSFFIYPFIKNLIGIDNPLGSNVLYHLTFLSNFDVINIQENCPGNDAMSQGITWSVSIEEQFYLFWPLIFAFLPRKGWFFAILFIIGGSVYFRILNHENNSVLYFHTFSVLADLGIGGLAAYLVKKFAPVKRFFENTGSKTHLLLFAFSFCLLFWGDPLFSFKYGNAIGRIVIAASFALIITAQALTKTNSRLDLSRLTFPNNWGKYTYGIYLLHPIAITILDVLVRVLNVPKTNFISLFLIGILGFVLTLILSKTSFIYFEARFLKLKHRFDTEKKAPETLVAAK
ncbi:acyltransferase family protein [Adhaeribacter soli]|uniref:Acyltransferase n=1 Tax=Adhaeribacter soli TaxID=2607655 RepID=A0A5N1IM34_9BACT|nr:acyltransferase [Adhaeribacter soli]KAA9331132.1 acyltransferase [Adhaeribacter soli]